MPQEYSRASSKQNKNRSMLSTHHMSCNYSHGTNFYQENKGNKSAVLAYSEIPFQKIAPRWNQSSATWRYTSHKYSFSKDSRFKNYRVEYTDIIQPQIPTTRTSKTCTFGKGNKKPISTVVLRNAKQKPAPDRYSMVEFDQHTRRKDNGKSFGIAWKAYQKNFISHRKDIYASFQTENNPPAKYQVSQIPGKDKKKFSAYGRLKMYTQKMSQNKNWVPGPHYNIKDRHLQNTAGLNERNFAFGQRIDLSAPANDYPGSKYIIPGFCARFGDIRHKSQRISPQKNDILY